MSSLALRPQVNPFAGEGARTTRAGCSQVASVPLEILPYLGAGSRHTTVTSSATAIPSDTSTKRCEATTQGGRVCATSRTMVSVMAAKR